MQKPEARRRLLTSVLALGVAAGGGFLAFRAFLQPLPSEPRLSPERRIDQSEVFPGIWWETDPENLAVNQTDPLPWQLDPVEAAIAFVDYELEWSLDAVDATRIRGGGKTVVVEVANRELLDGSLKQQISLRQLGQQGEGGIWSVVDVTSNLVRIHTPKPDSAFLTGDRVRVRASVSRVLRDVRASGSLYRGELDASYILKLGSDGRVTGKFALPEATGENAGLFVAIRDANKWEGYGVAGIHLNVLGPYPPLDPSLPIPVAETRDRIFEAAADLDYDALGRLLDPAAFRFSDGIVGDPVRFWKRLELQGIGVAGFIKAVLRAPAARVGETFVWPAAATKPPEEWTAEDYDVFADVEVDVEGSGFQGVTSVRLEIGPDGTWKAFLGPY